MVAEISPETQKYVMDFQSCQQQLQSMMMQRNSLAIQLAEAERAIEELDKTAETHVYKAVGNILIRSEKAAVRKELLERKEFFNVRIESMGKEEKRVRERLAGLQAKLQDAMKTASDR